MEQLQKNSALCVDGEIQGVRLEFGAFAAFRSWFRANVANDIVSASNGAVGAVCIAREKAKHASGKALSRELIMKHVPRNFTGQNSENDNSQNSANSAAANSAGTGLVRLSDAKF